VHQPALPSSPQHALFARQMRIAPPAFSFELRSRSSAECLPSKTLLFKNATSLGGAESLIEWRHQWDNSMSPLLLRVSVGLEDPSALIADLEQALASVE
jgi:cystathionine gamma-synthase